MFITIISFAITGVLFVILSFFVEAIWWYYIPAALLATSIYLKIIQPGWEENVGTLMTNTARMDPSAAAGYISIISFVYGVICIFTGKWIALSVCAFLFILSLTMRFGHRQFKGH
jgi:hypothetical protein